MPIYKPSELRPFLREHGLLPKKGLSQNFLIDGNILRKIADASRVEADDVVLEIGPGPGSLTECLLERGPLVIAVEKDPKLAKALERIQTKGPRLSIFCEDILSFPLEKEIAPLLRNGKKAKVIANLPYHLTTPILALLIPQKDLFDSLTVMVQEEVARRMTGLPGTADYGSFSIFVKFYTDPHYAFTVSRNCFYPVPKVDSAIIVLKLRKPPLGEKEADAFFKLTREAFKHRRKMLRSSLKDFFPPSQIEEALSSIGQSPLARPEALSLEDFLQLFALIN